MQPCLALLHLREEFKLPQRFVLCHRNRPVLSEVPISDFCGPASHRPCSLEINHPLCGDLQDIAGQEIIYIAQDIAGQDVGCAGEAHSELWMWSEHYRPYGS